METTAESDGAGLQQGKSGVRSSVKTTAEESCGRRSRDKFVPGRRLKAVG